MNITLTDQQANTLLQVIDNAIDYLDMDMLNEVHDLSEIKKQLEER